jgi:hypothetical protein
MPQGYAPVDANEPHDDDDDYDEGSEESLSTIWLVLFIHFFGAALCIPALPMLILEICNRECKKCCI